MTLFHPPIFATDGDDDVAAFPLRLQVGIGWAGSGGAGAGAGAGAEPVKKNAELGGVVMLHDDMVAADQEEALPPGTQESINEVEMVVSEKAADGSVTAR